MKRPRRMPVRDTVTATTRYQVAFASLNPQDQQRMRVEHRRMWLAEEAARREAAALKGRTYAPRPLPIYPPLNGLVFIGPGKVRVMPEDAQRIRDRESIEEVSLKVRHVIGSEDTGTQIIGPGTVRVPRWQADMLREGERNAAATALQETEKRAGIIGVRNGGFAVRPVDYEAFDAAWMSATPVMSISGG